MRVCQQYPQAKSQFFAIDTWCQEELPVDVSLVGIDELNLLKSCDYLICCLGGYLLNKVIRQYKQSSTKIISLFPGIVSHYQLDAFISRFNADQVWLNCPADLKLYGALCQAFGVENNGILYGASWFMDMPYHKINGNGGVVFFEQTQIINDEQTAYQIEHQLLEIIKKNPHKTFIYKLRQNVHNKYLIDIRKNIEQFKNVKVTDSLAMKDICHADTYISISSSALIEGILLGKKSYLLGRSYLDFDSREVYEDSGMFLDLPNQTFNLDWCSSRVQAPDRLVDLFNCNKQPSAYFNQKNVLAIVWRLFLVAYSNPKIWKIFLKNGRFKSIQKSLSYL